MSKGREEQLIATAEDWTNLNPILRLGEFGIEATFGTNNEILTARFKIGDGVTRWNLIPYTSETTYPYTESLNSPLGSLESNRNYKGTNLYDMIRDMNNTYQNPNISNFRANGNTSSVLEIGQQISGAISFSWNISNGINVEPNTGAINVSENGIINPPSAFELTTASPLSANLIAAYSKLVPGNFSFTIRGQNTQGSQLANRSIFYYWLSRIRAGVSTNPNITNASEVTAMANNYLTSTIKRDYTFEPGYPYLFIPEFLESQLNTAVFKNVDVVTGSVLFDYAIFPIDELINGTSRYISYTNTHGVTFNYVIYRGQYSYGATNKLRIL